MSKNWILIFLFLGLIWSCAPRQRQPISALDTPLHHYQQGIKNLDSGQLEQAGQEFELSLELDRDYGPALAGMGLVQVWQGNKEGLKLIKRGQRKSDGKQEKIWTLSADIRACRQLQRQNIYSVSKMVSSAKQAWTKAKVINSIAPGPWYYMGEVYIQALDFEQAEKMFAQVKELDNGLVTQADKKWQLIQKARRAAPQTAIGKKIALVEKITRAEMAALLVEEMNIARVFGSVDTARFVEPGVRKKADLQPGDIDGHPLQGDIRQVVEYDINGLGVYPSGRFEPDKEMTRAETALVFEDIMLKASGNDKLATRFIGQSSPFPDVSDTNYAFNAIMLCTTRGLMLAALKHSAFYPQESMAGVDVLLGLNKIKEQLRVF